MKVALIHNPNAGDDSGATAGQLQALIREAGHKVRLQSVKERNWPDSIGKRADLVAVAGGDGTVGEAARRLVGKRIPIAVLPMGTANNISRTLGIVDKSVFELIPGWARARRVHFDAGIATGPWGSAHFIEGLGIGLFARAIPRIQRNRTMANLAGGDVRVAYALQLMREHLERSRPMKLHAALDGKDISGKYLLFEAMNTRYIGPNLFLAPHVAHGAGLLDIVFVAEKDRKKLARFLARWQEGKLWPPDLGVCRGRQLEIEWTGFPLHMDDRLWPVKGGKRPRPPATIRIEPEPAALEFLVPGEPDDTPRKHRTSNGKSTRRARDRGR
jgi:diacylglycerol kinase family enzyme